MVRVTIVTRAAASGDGAALGEALRQSMVDNPAEPTVYVRTLFADPAFNPYEPGNGFSDQGRPDIGW